MAYLASFGYRDLASKTPMTDDTIFAIASMTKPITSVAVMTLVEQGKIGLDDPAEKYLPELKEMRVLGDSKDDQGETIATVPARAPDHDPPPAGAHLGVLRPLCRATRGCGGAMSRPAWSGTTRRA